MQWIQNQNFHIVLPILIAFSMNGIIYGLKWQKSYERKDNKKDVVPLPPGYIIGTIWIIIFGILGYVHYLLYKIKNKISIQCILLEIFIIFCVLYPIFTQFKEKLCTIINYVSLLFTFIIALMIMNVSIDIFWYLIPLILWVSYVNLYTILNCAYIL